MGCYYNNLDLTDLVLSRVDANLDMDWGQGSPDPAIDPETFSIRWRGEIEPLYTEVYTFSSSSDDGVRLWIDGRLVVDGWYDGLNNRSGQIALTGGVRHAIMFDYYDRQLGAGTELSWRSLSQAQEMVPSSRLYTNACANTAPWVSAGSDKTSVLPAAVILNGTIVDDGMPAAPGCVTALWSKASGPGAVLFDDVSSVNTFATFSTNGSYVLRLNAWDGELCSHDDMSVTVTAGGGTGCILRTCWTEVYGGAVSNLTSQAKYPGQPDWSEYLASFESPTNWDDLYGSRLSGFVHPAQSGQYRFYISSDDGAELWLSSDDNPANKTLIASVSGWNWPGEWDKYPEQESALVTLTAGQRYYIEALHADHVSGDHLTVGWRRPDATFEAPIPGSRLSAYPVANSAPVVDLMENLSVTGLPPFRVALAADVADDALPVSGSMMYEWLSVSGPGGVVFDPPNSAVTTAILFQAGVYVLRLDVFDGQATGRGEVEITLTPENQPPVVDAGRGWMTLSPSVMSAQLDGTVTDDGLPVPPAAVTTLWSVVSGPGEAIISDASAVDTTIAFTNRGIYILRLAAYDGGNECGEDKVVIALSSAGEAPVLIVTNAFGPGHVLANGTPFVSFRRKSGSAWATGCALNSQDDGLGDWTEQVIGESSASYEFERTFAAVVDARPVVMSAANGIFKYAINGEPDGSGTWQTQVGGYLHNNRTYGLAAAEVDGRPIVVFGTQYQRQQPQETETGYQRVYVNPWPEGTGSWSYTTVEQKADVQYFGGNPMSVDGRPAFAYCRLTQLVFAINASAEGLGAWTTSFVSQAAAATPSLGLIGGAPAIAFHGSETEGADLKLAVNDAADGSGAWSVTTLDEGDTKGCSFATVDGMPAISYLADGRLTYIINSAFDAGGSWQKYDIAEANGNVTALASWPVGGGIAYEHQTNIWFTPTPIPGASNQLPPEVSAGSDMEITFPVNSVSLDGTVTDDGKPNPPNNTSVAWSLVSGPGGVMLDNWQMEDTTALFARIGSYVLRLSASDGQLTEHDDVTVTVNGASAYYGIFHESFQGDSLVALTSGAWNVTSFGSDEGWDLNPSGGYALASVSSSDASEDTYLLSPVFDCSPYAGVRLQFAEEFRTWSSSKHAFGILLGSTDGGATWSAYSNCLHAYAAGAPGGTIEGNVILAMDWAGGESQVRLAWRYCGNRDGFWRIDDVALSACALTSTVRPSVTLLSPPAQSPSRHEICVETQPGRTFTIEFTDDYLGGEVTWHPFANSADGVGAWTETNEVPSTFIFIDTEDAQTSGHPPPDGRRYYRIRAR